MISDEDLAEVMAVIASQDDGRLQSMLRHMTPQDVTYMKGYVAGYAEAVRHLQLAYGPERGAKGTDTAIDSEQ